MKPARRLTGVAAAVAAEEILVVVAAAAEGAREEETEADLAAAVETGKRSFLTIKT
jgi:hypothetical protein